MDEQTGAGDGFAIRASELAEKGARRVRSLDPAACAGLAAGGPLSLNPKKWVNEDSLALHRLPDGSALACVADAHWGGAAGETVAAGLLPAFERAPGATPRERLLAALLALDAEHRAGRAPDDESETTALLVHLAGGELSWASVGDSLLLHVAGPGECRLLNPLGGAFLGAEAPLRPDLPSSLLAHGATTLPRGTVVLLATDGLEPLCSGLGPQDVARELRRARPLEQRLARLLELASEPARGGGADNLGLVALTV